MLQTLARNHRPIAWFFVSVFYLQLVLVPAVTRANEPLRYPFRMPAPASGTVKTPVGNLMPLDRKAVESKPDKISRVANARPRFAPKGIKGTFTTGPTQPEMQSFQSVGANNLVDLFSGDFSYNIPLLDVGGYPVNLHYQSGITMDQEASWVGLGWNINPGVISRNMRGLPDDFNGETGVKKTISTKPNKTFGVTVAADIELVGFPLLSAGVTLGVFHNTYRGWGIEYALNASINSGSSAKGPLSGGLSIGSNSQSGVNISPSMGVHLGSNESKTQGNISIGTNYNSRTGIQALQMTGQVKQSANVKKMTLSGGAKITTGISFAKPSYTPSINVPYTSTQFSYTAKVGTTAWSMHPSGALSAYGSTQEIAPGDKTQEIPAYGYMYYEKTGNNRNVLLDFNREKDIPYTDKTPHIAVPVYTYDIWSISGEGTGGMFRPYRGDIGYIYDHSSSTKSKSNNFALDVGFGGVLHTGFDYNAIDAGTTSKGWEAGNSFVQAVPFKERDGKFENVYFKNPAEKTVVNKQYLQAVGDDYLMRVKLSPGGQNNPDVTATNSVALFKGGREVSSKTFDLNTLRADRDKRSQVISYLSADEAEAAGLDKKIRSYHLNSFPVAACANNFDELSRLDDSRKKHHLSEITVLNADGKRYVYGIPVYNKKQVEVTMATKPGDNKTGLVQYSAQDKSVNNTQGKDGYFNREDLPGYSHSFLLTGILSPDYSDLRGDGITEDDNGDAVKFNYSRVYGLANPYLWRAPYDAGKASYNEGLKTDSRDERGSFTYGEREVWYLNSIESKTMMATFVVSADRKDGFGVANEDGGQNAAQPLYRLHQINLYTKSDYLKNGGNAKPIKTVHFEYSYELCRNNPGSATDSGKLTLKKIWFSYNKNKKGKRNPYVFSYHSNNPKFDSKAVDRWGNYKSAANNPGTSGGALTNADYSYTLQEGVKNWDSAKAAANAAPWTLNEIKLPSGARIKVTYESDDYAYVQNKRAMQFFTVAGFGSSPSSSIQPQLYPAGSTGSDYKYVFIQVSDAVSSRTEVQRKYLEGVNQLFFKLAVNVPADRWGKGFEIIPVYCDIEDFGVRSGNNKMIWVKVKSVNDNESPFATAALQFLRLNLYSKAYPFSEPGDNLDIKTIVNMMVSVSTSIFSAFSDFNKKAHRNNWCNTVVTDRSFARLDNPRYKKLGGGHRVKQVEIYDNWKNMTGQEESVYGQTYDYSTTIDLNGTPTRISSGVATFEPVVGSDENPFRVPMKLYTEKVGAMAPTDYMYSEEPFAETFFPSPSVGYSKVRVQTIHKERKSANGFQESEFYTSKDFPVLVEYTPLDGDSKKTYNPKVQNFFKVDAKNYVTLSQGFKIELNDMNGKMKSQASYSQNDLNAPISYTYHYYRLKNDNAGQPQLSNVVAAAAPATGIVDPTAEIGREVEVMVDVREQISITQNKGVQTNVIWAHPFPPIFLGSVIPVPNKETNRYRSVAVLKVVNRYGILDSVVHTEKGSTVTTRDLVYDAETGGVLLSQTNNEFDDPVYNFTYPAHWAYSGMEPAYRNIGTILKNVVFRKGIMFYQNGQRVPVNQYFESGDELLVFGQQDRKHTTEDHCLPEYYDFTSDKSFKKVWAVDASRGKEKQQGIYFVDLDGAAYSANADQVKIIRSGKRNLAGTPVGSVTSLRSPLRNASQLVFDNQTGVITANAARFKDLWRVDSTIYRKDTSIIATHRLQIHRITLTPDDVYGIHDYKPAGGNRGLGQIPDQRYFEASAYDDGESSWDEQIRSYLRFNMDGIPQNAIITSANLRLYGTQNIPSKNERGSGNMSWIERLSAGWVRDVIDNATNEEDIKYARAFYWSSAEPLDLETRVSLSGTLPNINVVRNENVSITAMARAMLHDRYALGNPPVIRIRLDDPGGGHKLMNRRIYNTQLTPEECPSTQTSCLPAIDLEYIIPCDNGSEPWFSTTPPFGADDQTPGPGYYCNLSQVDTFLCKPNINDTAVNLYRLGILGNWRMDRAYTYYDRRAQSDPGTVTNARRDGEINNFAPFWSFAASKLQPGSDEMRWVWNSELMKFNIKGFEIENHDPLNRFNAGQYGYNQTLPVAVAQNAQSREIAYDGFEDYSYRTNDCIKCVLNRHVDLGSGANLVDDVSHSGLYSLRLNGNQTFAKTFEIGSAGDDNTAPELYMKEDSIPLASMAVRGNGTGLGNYYYTNGGGCHPYNESDPNQQPLYTGYNTNINYQIGVNPILNTCRTDWIYYSFRGYIQPIHTGLYKFWATADDAMSIYITKNGVTRRITEGRFIEDPTREEWEYATAYETETIELEAGELYEIAVLWDNNGGDYRAKLEWESLTGDQLQGREIIPATQLYPAGSDVNAVKAGTVFRDTTWCVQFKHPRVTNGNQKRFSPLKDRKAVVSAWVKQDVPCVNGNYDNTQLELAFDDGSSSTFSFRPAGNIIEGWQRIEGIVPVPATAHRVTIKMQSLSSTPVYFDDVRIHPFNSNMKSYVYNPVNLRLMAELDENNYATFYEYDDEGTLIRLKKETEQGIKTIKETRSALLKEKQTP
ncbi:GLEYA domain-containing protein [Longitalea luteola]|uniref:GLEYA domain-containing protein n=1 Tax=Longitalea luteola TaxID=2812563 RepID=UPI001A96AC1A|nr:GLEYA domain-containing protein [Longitalea luteola]